MRRVPTQVLFLKHANQIIEPPGGSSELGRVLDPHLLGQQITQALLAQCRPALRPRAQHRDYDFGRCARGQPDRTSNPFETQRTVALEDPPMVPGAGIQARHTLDEGSQGRGIGIDFLDAPLRPGEG